MYKECDVVRTKPCLTFNPRGGQLTTISNSEFISKILLTGETKTRFLLWEFQSIKKPIWIMKAKIGFYEEM